MKLITWQNLLIVIAIVVVTWLSVIIYNYLCSCAISMILCHEIAQVRSLDIEQMLVTKLNADLT